MWAIQKQVEVEVNFYLVPFFSTVFIKDPKTYEKATKTFVKKAAKVVSANDATLQKALFTFAQEFVTSVSKWKRKKVLKFMFKAQQGQGMIKTSRDWAKSFGKTKKK